MSRGRRWRRAAERVQALLQTATLVLVLLAGVQLLGSMLAVVEAQPEVQSLNEYRFTALEKRIEKVEDSQSTQNKLLVGVLASVLTNMALYIVTRRREQSEEP